MYRCSQIIIGIFVGGLVGWAVATKNLLLLVIAITFGLALDYYSRTRLKDILEDEMFIRLGERASRRALQIFLSFAVVAGALLSTLVIEGYGYLVLVGYTLAYSACFLIILYIVFFWYYRRKGLD